MNRFRRYLPLSIGLAILGVICLIAPWQTIIPLLQQVGVGSLIAMLALAMVYFGTKSGRFWLMLRILGIRQPFSQVILIYLSAQPVSILPAGELYRSVLLERYLGVPIQASAPTVTLQGLIEAVVLLSFSLAGAFALGHDRVPVIITAALLVALLLSLRQGWLIGGERVLNKLPFVAISQAGYTRFIQDHQKLLASRPLAVITGISFIPVLCGIGIFYIAAHAVGASITPVQASIGYCLPVVLSGLSFLPGGLGASEGGTIVLLRLIRVGTAAAFATTLLVRLFTLGAGMIFGLIALTITHLTLEAHESSATNQS